MLRQRPETAGVQVAMTFRDVGIFESDSVSQPIVIMTPSRTWVLLAMGQDR
jgi:hypothetical protein